MSYADEQALYWTGYRAGTAAAVDYLATEYPGLGVDESYDDQPTPRDEVVAFAENVVRVALAPLDTPAPTPPTPLRRNAHE